MESCTYNKSQKRPEGSPEHGRYFKGLRFLMIKHLVTAILSMVLLMMVVPADASTGSVGNGRKSTCRARQTSSSYIVIVKKKNNPMVSASKKHSKKSKVRNYSFPL